MCSITITIGIFLGTISIFINMYLQLGTIINAINILKIVTLEEST